VLASWVRRELVDAVSDPDVARPEDHAGRSGVDEEAHVGPWARRALGEQVERRRGHALGAEAPDGDGHGPITIPAAWTRWADCDIRSIRP
jgi:hypothetical protein